MNEDQIQLGFTQWIKSEKTYKEYFSDPNGGAGAVCDSIGLVQSTPYLIEFKRFITPSVVCYTDKASTSIERKIKCSLERIYQKAEFVTDWDKLSNPHVVLIAETISKAAIIELNKMLVNRSKEWGFSFEFGTWSNDRYICLGQGYVKNGTTIDYNKVKFPLMPSIPSFRNPKRNLEEFRDVASQRGVLDLFNYFLQLAKENGLSIRFNRESLTLSAKSIKSSNLLNIIGIWPDDSGRATGLCIASKPERITQCFQAHKRQLSIPGTKTTKKGFLGERYFLRDISEINSYWDWVNGKQYVTSPSNLICSIY